MGRSKPLLNVGGQPLVAVHVEALSAVANPVIVVIGAAAESVRAALPPGVIVVENVDWRNTWPADSLRLALQVADVTGPCWVTPVDVPPAAAETLAALAAAGAPAVPEDPQGRPGHPVFLDAELTASIRAKAPEDGLRSMLSSTTRIPVSAGDVGVNFNDPVSFRDWLEPQ